MTLIMIIESKLHSDKKYREYNITHWYKNKNRSVAVGLVKVC